MKKVQYVQDHGRRKSGYVVAVSDETAADLIDSGIACAVPDDTGLKKSGGEFYAYCAPMSAAKAAAKASAKAARTTTKPPEQEEQPEPEAQTPEPENTNE